MDTKEFVEFLTLAAMIDVPKEAILLGYGRYREEGFGKIYVTESNRYCWANGKGQPVYCGFVGHQILAEKFPDYISKEDAAALAERLGISVS